MSTRREALPSNAVANREPLPGSRKVYVAGPRGIRVPFREIALPPTRARGETELNPPLRVYDTSGPYTDPAVAIDLERGLPELRQPWILRGGEYDRRAPVRRTRPASLWRRPREVLRGRRQRRRRCTTRGRAIVTPEMEFVAIRERVPPEFVRERGRPRPRHHPGQHQPPRARADDHRPELPGEDQRQHRQLGRRPPRSRRRSRRWRGRPAGAPTR